MIRLRTLGSLDLTAHDQEACTTLLAQPKRVALLVYLAVTSARGFRRRDTLLGAFWPELDEEHARGALRQALRFIRRALGNDVFVTRGVEEIRLDEKLVWCDAVAFGASLERGENEKALDLYRGDLLEGFFIGEAPEFERWLERERRGFKERAAEVAWTLAEATHAQGDLDNAARWARRAAGFSPGDEGAIRRLITFLDRIGDRSSAIQAYEAFAWRLKEEYELEPSPETIALAENIRARLEPRDELTVEPTIERQREGTAEPPVVSTAAVAPEPPSTETPESRTEQRLLVERLQMFGRSALRAPMARAAVVIAALAVLGTVAVVLRESAFVPGTAYAVEHPRRSYVSFPFGVTADDPALAWLAEGAVSMLTMDLEGWQEIRVVDRRRVAALAASRGISRGDDVALDDALAVARDARVGTLLLGDVVGQAGNLDIVVRLYDVASGEQIEQPIQAAGSTDEDLRPLIDRLAARILSLSGAPAIGPDLRASTTASVDAYREYLQGLEHFYRWELEAAVGRFATAVKYDSTFALAYQRLALAMTWRESWDQDEVRALTEQAVRHSERLPWRERQHILAFNAFHHGDTQLASQLYWELVARDSTDAEAWYYLADVEFHEEESTVRDSSGRLVPTWDLDLTLKGFERSVELDPRFHIAYGHLFNMYEILTPGGGFMFYDVPDDAMVENDSLVVDGRALFYPVWRDSAFWVQLNPRDPGALISRYASDSVEGVLRERAVRYARRWSNAAPDESRPHFELRNWYVQGRHWAAARAAQEAYLALEADTSYQEQIILGVLHLGSGSFDAAETLVEEALASDPEPRSGNPAAGVFVARGRPRRALEVADIQPSQGWFPAGGRRVVHGFSDPLVARIRMLGAAGAAGAELTDAVDSLMRIWSARFGPDDLGLVACSQATRIGPALVLAGYDAVRRWLATFPEPLTERCRTQSLPLAWQSYLQLGADSLSVARQSLELAIAEMERRYLSPRPFDLYFLAGLAQALDRHSVALDLYERLDSSRVWSLYGGNRGPGYDWGLISLSYLQRASSYETLGDTSNATQYYEKFLDAWQDPEPDVRHYADRARDGLRRLQGTIER